MDRAARQRFGGAAPASGASIASQPGGSAQAQLQPLGVDGFELPGPGICAGRAIGPREAGHARQRPSDESCYREEIGGTLAARPKGHKAASLRLRAPCALAFCFVLPLAAEARSRCTAGAGSTGCGAGSANGMARSGVAGVLSHLLLELPQLGDVLLMLLQVLGERVPAACRPRRRRSPWCATDWRSPRARRGPDWRSARAAGPSIT